MVAPHPQALCDRIERLCRVHSQQTAAEIVGITMQVVSKIKHRGFKAAKGKQQRPMPPDFPIQANYMTIRELAVHYRAGHGVVRRWAAEVGRAAMPSAQPCKAIPDRDVIVSAIDTHGLGGAHIALGVSRDTLRNWRQHHGLPLRGKPNPPARPGVGWADSYFQNRSGATA